MAQSKAQRAPRAKAADDHDEAVATGAAVRAMIAAQDEISNRIDDLPLNSPARRRLVRLLRSMKAPLDAFLADDTNELQRLERIASSSLRDVSDRGRENFTVPDCPAPCVPLDAYGLTDRVQALGDVVVGNMGSTLENAERALRELMGMHREGRLDAEAFADVLPWIALNLHEGKVNAGQAPLLPQGVAGRPSGSPWPETDQLKMCFDLWSSDYDTPSESAFRSLLIAALKIVGVNEDDRKGLFAGAKMRRRRRLAATATRTAKVRASAVG